MDKRTTGLHNKFRVERVDGKSAPGEKHDGCEYFVLDLTHDPHAAPALRAYAASCREDYPILAVDLMAKVALSRPLSETDWQRKYCDESRIVDEVWAALGIHTYEQAQGKHIATIVRELKAENAQLKEQVALARPLSETKEDEVFSYETLLGRLNRAHTEVTDLCKGTRRWTMCIPVQDSDSDMVIGDAIRHAIAFVEAVKGRQVALSRPHDTETLQRIMQVLGPKAPSCCEGCSYEIDEALRILRAAGIEYRRRGSNVAASPSSPETK